MFALKPLPRPLLMSATPMALTAGVRSILLRLLLPVLLAACSQLPQQGAQAPDPSLAADDMTAPPVMPTIVAADGEVLPPVLDGQSFEAWLGSVRDAARRHGIAEATLATLFDDLTLSPAIVALDRNQPEVRASYAAYMEKRFTPTKVARGLSARNEVEEHLSAAETAYGVPAPVLVAIWGMETNYGSYTGRTPVVRALASLAYDGRRSALFRRELWAVMRIVDQQRASPADLRGSWAGAFGQTQFMPTSFLRYAVDGDGDGRVDLWRSAADIFASTANLLATNGWEPGLRWGFEVRLPDGFDREAVRATERPAKCVPALSRHSSWLAAGVWQQLGVTAVNGGTTWPAPETELTLVEPDGPDGPAYLTSRNYRVLLDYNCSNFYALSVALLAEALDVPPQPDAPNPEDAAQPPVVTP